MKPLFILTSAINTKFGVYTTEQRMAQMLDSINSVRTHAPGAKIAVIEMAGIPLTADQEATLRGAVDYLYNYTDDEAVKDIFNSTNNWDIVKNTTEVMIFGNAIGQMYEAGVIDQFDRIFKMSGRYLLTDNFNPAYYNTVPDSIVVLQRKTSQFPAHVTDGMQYQYMSRLWSWPTNLTPEILEAYSQGFLAMATRIAEGGYFDIEHMLFKYLPVEHVTEIPRMGLTGLLGPNGVRIED